MNQRLEKLLSDTAEEAFASMVFVFPAEDDDPSGPPTDERVSTELEFSGPFEGRVTLSVPRDMPPILAANVLGLDEPNSSGREQQEDTLREVLNVISGNLLPRLTSPRDVFHVHPPRLTEPGEETDAADHWNSQARVALQLECGLAELELFTHASVAPIA